MDAEVQYEVSIGKRTGLIYVRDPNKCSKISGTKTQCQREPAPGYKTCQFHINQRKEHDISRKRKPSQASSQRSLSFLHGDYDEQSIQKNLPSMDVFQRGANRGLKYVRDPTKCSKISGTKTQCQRESTSGYKTCQQREISPPQASSQSSLRIRVLHENYDEQSIQKNLPSMDVFQRVTNGELIERKLYKRKSTCDSIYSLKLEMNDQPPLQSWIKYKELISFTKGMDIDEWRKINNLPLRCTRE